jgi:DNA-binding transcriptional regulator YiaG
MNCNEIEKIREQSKLFMKGFAELQKMILKLKQDDFDSVENFNIGF